jgi:5-hydroxyisourate hydrolase
MSGISTHVLDLARGRPAAGVAVLLERESDGVFRELARAATDDDGRVGSLMPPSLALLPGRYRLTFELAPYFAALGVEAFFPVAALVFDVRDANQKHHVPLLLSPFGYSTYRGS